MIGLNTTVLQKPGSVFTGQLPGHPAKTGPILSVTVTVNEAVASGAQPLLEVMVTFVTPWLNVEPLPVPLPLPVVAPVKA